MRYRRRARADKLQKLYQSDHFPSMSRAYNNGVLESVLFAHRNHGS